MNGGVARRTGSAARPVPESLLRFEYLINAMKLRYLEDCFTHPVNREARFFSCSSEPLEQVRLTSSDGKPFMAYINRPTYIGGKGSVPIGPLFSSITPDTISECQEITAVNKHLYRREMQTDDWFRIFCECVLVKTVIHGSSPIPKNMSGTGGIAISGQFLMRQGPKALLNVLVFEILS